jgi:integrase
MSNDGSVAQLRLFEFGGVDMEALRKRRDDLRKATRARRTVVGYASDWRVFEQWCADAGRVALPANSETVSLYATWMLSAGGRRCSTTARHLAGIVDRHRRESVTVPAIAEAREVIAATRRECREKPQGKAALAVDDFARIAKACDARTNLGSRDRAMVVLGFATSLRRSDLARLQITDVTFSPRGLVVVNRRSKTDQQGKGRIIAVWPGKRATTDPVRVLHAWLKKRGNWDGPLFCALRKGDALVKRGITGEAVNEAVKRAVTRVGLDPEPYGAHSLRAGAITASAERGRSDQEIMSLSGHESPKVMKMYVRGTRLFAGRNPLAGAL